LKNNGRIDRGTDSKLKLMKKIWLSIFGKCRSVFFDIPKNAFYLKKILKKNFREIRVFIKKPVRHISHLSILIVMVLVFLSNGSSGNIFAKKGDATVDPLGISKVDKVENTINEETDSQITATLASVLREDLAGDAFARANEKASKISMTTSSPDYLIKTPNAFVTSSASNGGTKEYVVQNGDTLWSIARANNVTTDTIRWANGITDIDNVSPGTKIIVPTAVGVLHTVRDGETIAGIASRYSASAAQIESYNNVIDEELVAGMKIMVPDGVGEALPEKPAPVPEAPSNRNTRGTQYAEAPSYISSSSGPNRFPWGYCTYYVARRRNIPWNGNAWQWYGNARGYGVATGGTPVAGAVMVTWESSVGHVAYVESVNGSTFTVSEMNYVGYGRISRRTISTGSVPLIGFIY